MLTTAEPSRVWSAAHAPRITAAAEYCITSASDQLPPVLALDESPGRTGADAPLSLQRGE